MRIPEETLLRPFEQQTRQPPPGEKGTEPVDRLTPSRDALSRTQPRPDKNHAKDLLDEQERRKRQRSEEAEERRGYDRRKKQQDVLLDTRTTPSRRRSALYPPVDVKV